MTSDSGWVWLMLLFFLFFIVVGALFCSRISKTIAVIDPPMRSRSPGSAWLLYVPLFNLVWMFFLVSAIKDGFQRMTAAGRLSQPSDGAGSLGMTLAVTNVLGIVLGAVPYVGIVSGLVGLVVLIMYWVRLVELERIVLPEGATLPRPKAADTTVSHPRVVQMVSAQPDAHVRAMDAVPGSGPRRMGLPPRQELAISPPPSPSRSASALLASHSDDALFEQVALELDSGQMAKALWTRAFAEADGDENRARAIYIRLRIARLQEEAAANSSRAAERAQHAPQRAALLQLQRSLLTDTDRARCEADTFDAVRLRAAVGGGDIGGMRDIIGEKPYLRRVRTSEGESLLQLATRQGRSDMVRVLLQQGVVDVPDERGQTALALAKQAHPGIAEILQDAAKERGTRGNAQVPVGKGQYRDYLVVLRADGTVSIEGSDGHFTSVEAAVDAIDNELDRAAA